ncbi:MAG TPA: Ig-like domain-containing protein, partial [Methanobacterium sp.]|nr:Ig-like domain-containing protein [Methanobacterium sp.]
TFNEPIKPGTMNIQLKTNTGTNIPTTNTINGNTLTITPNNPLKKATKYTIILYAGSITDLAGNPITKYSRPFTTAAV